MLFLFMRSFSGGARVDKVDNFEGCDEEGEIMRMRSEQIHCASGFTLLELLVVIAVLGILFTFATVGVTQALESGRETTCKSNLRALGISLEQDFLEDLEIPVDIRIARAQDTWGSSDASEQNRVWTAGFPLLADLPPLPAPPPPPPPPPPPWNDDELAGLACPLAPPNPVYDLDPINEPQVRSFGIRFEVLGASLDRAGWLLAESDIRHVKRREDLAVRHRGRLHLYHQGGGVVPVTADEVEFSNP